jgi:hypothetical protein
LNASSLSKLARHEADALGELPQTVSSKRVRAYALTDSRAAAAKSSFSQSHHVQGVNG